MTTTKFFRCEFAWGTTGFDYETDRYATIATVVRMLRRVRAGEPAVPSEFAGEAKADREALADGARLF